MKLFLSIAQGLLITLSLFCTALSFALPTRILVYSGDGTDPSLVQGTINGLESTLLEQTYTIERVDAATLQNEPLDPNDIALIFIPGGTGSSAYAAALGEAGLRNIVNYVAAGGRFAGACAGGALMARTIIYTLPNGQTLEVHHPNDTFLFDGIAYGPAITTYNSESTGQSASMPAFNWIDTDQADIDQADIIEIKAMLSKPLYLYWNGGCLFVPSLHVKHPPHAASSSTNTNTCTTCLSYSGPLHPPIAELVENQAPERPNNPALIIGQYGEGQYLLTGAHPELGTTNWLTQLFRHQITATITRMQAIGWERGLSIFEKIDTNTTALVLALCLHRLGIQVRSWEQFIPSALPY